MRWKSTSAKTWKQSNNILNKSIWRKEIIDNLVPRAIPFIAKRCAGDEVEIIENTAKQSKVEHLRNVDQKRRIYSESIRVKKKSQGEIK